jgi:hypothetical protein
MKVTVVGMAHFMRRRRLDGRAPERRQRSRCRVSRIAIPFDRSSYSCQLMRKRASGVYEQNVPVRMVVPSRRPNAASSSAIRATAALMARVALRRARSEADAALRSWPCNPTARESSPSMKSISARIFSARPESLNCSASSSSARRSFRDWR